MQQRGSGKIVNIGSVYSYVPVPRQAIYAASKAFVLSFSLALADEVKNYGISVTIICPGSTITNFHARSGSKKPSRRFTMSAAEVANQSFTAIEKGKLIFIPGGINRIFVSVASLLPRRFLSSFVKWLVYRVRDFD
jgi:short-subunit dehydrogenase